MATEFGKRVLSKVDETAHPLQVDIGGGPHRVLVPFDEFFQGSPADQIGLTNPVGPFEEVGLTTPDEEVQAFLVQQGMDEAEAALKAFAYGELVRGDAVPSSRESKRFNVKEELMLLGESKEILAYEEELTTIRQLGAIDDVQAAITAGIFGANDGAVKLSDSQRAGRISVEDETLIRAGESPPDASLLDDELKGDLEFSYEDWVNEQLVEKDAMALHNADIVASLDPAFKSLWGDAFSEAAVPFAISTSSAQFAFQAEGLIGKGFVDQFMAGIEGFFFIGESRDRLRNIVRAVPASQRPDFARNLAEIIRDKSGVLHDNDVQTIDWIETVINTSLDDRTKGGWDWDRTLYNLITLVDGIPLIRKAPQFVKAIHGRYFSKLARVDRKKAADYLKTVTHNEESVKGLAAPPDELASTQLPKHRLEDVDGTPSVVQQELNLQLPNSAQITRSADQGAINFTEVELFKFAQKLRSTYQSLQGGVFDISKFVIDASSGTSVSVEAFFHRTMGGGGWLSPKSALNAAEKLTGGAMERVQVLFRNSEGGFDRFLTGKELRARYSGAKATPDGTEYFIQIRGEHIPTQADLMAFKGNPVFMTAGGWGRWLASAQQQFSKEVWAPIFSALGRGSIFEKSALELAEPYWRLSSGSRRRVAKMIEQGALDKITYTPRELVDKFQGITVGEMRGYYGFRMANDTAWAVANRTVYRELSSQNYRTMSAAGHDQPYLVRPLRDDDITPQRAYNPKTKTIVPVTKEDLARYRKAGGDIEVVHKNDDIVMGGEATRYIIRTGRKGTELSGLPINILKYEGGYVANVYKDPFFVVRNIPIKRNGISTVKDKPLTRQEVVMSARTQREAEQLAEDANKAAGTEQHTVKSVEEGNPGARLLNDTMALEQHRLVFSRRAEKPLQRADGTHTPVADPVEALHRSVQAISRYIGIEQVLKVQERKFFQTFEDVLDNARWQKYGDREISAGSIAEDLKKSKHPQAKAALQQWNYYRMLRGTDVPVFQREWARFINGVAEGTEIMLRSPTAGAFIANAARFDVLGFAKGMVFATLIATNPFRQYALQSMQFSFLAGANPRIAIQSIPDVAMLRNGLALIDTPEWEKWLASQASSRYSSKDISTLVRRFKESGLVSEITSYEYIGTQIAEKQLRYTPNRLGGGLQIAKNVINAPIRAGKRLGFEAGETINLSATYAFAVREHLSKTGKTIASLTNREWEQVGAQASAYALSMHKAGTFAYQQGFTSIFTQFWSIQHKSIMAMLPKALGGDRAFTLSQKAGIAASQFGFYGAAGWGVEELVRDIFVDTGVLDGVDEETRSNITTFVSTGFMELIMNGVMSEISGEDVSSSYGSSFAPAGAPLGTVTDFFMAIFTLGLQDAFFEETAMGSTMGRYHTVGQYIARTMFLPDFELVPNTPSKIERTLAVVPTIFSGVSQGLKGFYAMRMGQFITQYGDHRVQASWPETVAKGFFGVSTNAEEDYRRLTRLSKGSFNFDEKKARETASELWKIQVQNLLYWEEMGDKGINRETAIVEGERMVMALLTEHEAEMVRNEYLNIINKQRGTPTDIFDILWRQTSDNAVTPERMLRAVRDNEMMAKYPDKQEALIGLIENMMQGTNERMEWYKQQNMRFDDDLNWLIDDK